MKPADRAEMLTGAVFAVGDVVRVQHRKGGRVFYSTVHDIHVESGIEVATVTDPRNGGMYTLPTAQMKPANKEGRH